MGGKIILIFGLNCYNLCHLPAILSTLPPAWLCVLCICQQAAVRQLPSSCFHQTGRREQGEGKSCVQSLGTSPVESLQFTNVLLVLKACGNAQGCRCALSSVEQMERLTSLSLLATLVIKQPGMLFVFSAARAQCCVVSSWCAQGPQAAFQLVYHTFSVTLG